MKIAVIGGGAAGFFSAITAKQSFPNDEVTIYEKSAKVLSKVKVSGGGRCNVTHACFDNKELSTFYPRGANFLRKAFEQFNTQSTIDWFKKRGVELEALSDNCIFPKSNSSQTIIDCFEFEARQLGVKRVIQFPILSIKQLEDSSFELISSTSTVNVDRVIYTIGGQPKISTLEWLTFLNHPIVTPVPSLFTFNMPNESIRDLMGIVNELSTVRIEKSKWVAEGPLLITHWGMSGPAILKLSAFAARELAESEYRFAVLVNWLNQMKEEELRGVLQENKLIHSEKKISNYNPFGLKSRLWLFLVTKSGCTEASRWKDLQGKLLNKLVNNLINDRYVVEGKTTFKEEFVTAGGVDLSMVDVKNMQSKIIPGLFFAGEVLNIDGITGGFNFQAAWTTAYIAGKNVGLNERIGVVNVENENH
jgi:predicted Rossmann fold flavoprotein